MSEKRVGIIMHGVTGRMGMNQHLIRSILEIRKQGGVALKDGTRVVPDPLLVGRNAAKVEELARQHGVQRWTTDLDEALQNKEDEIFFDAASTQLRPKLLKRAIAAGKHIYCEKPVATTLAAAKDLYSAAKKARIKHGVVQDKLWLPGMLKLARLREEGFFGRILSVRGEFGYWVFEGDPQFAQPPAQRPSWNYRKQDGGGIILDMLCHWQEVQGDRRRCGLRHLPAGGRGGGAFQFIVGRARAARRSAHAAGGRHAWQRSCRFATLFGSSL